VIIRRASLIGAILFAIAAPRSFCQAIVLDQGQWTFGADYQHTFVRYHVGFDGVKADLGHIMGNTIRPSASYGLTDRVTLDGDIPLVSAKYIGTQPHGRLDDGTFHSTLQDFHLGARMNVMTRPLFVTPFIRMTVPSHHYLLEGHTAQGREKFELTPGLYAGRDLGPLLPNAFFEIMVSHTWVQRTYIEQTSERLNRTNGSLEIGYFLTPTVTVSLFGSGVRTHGGWSFPDHIFKNENEIEEHDRFDKRKDVQTGGSIAYTFHNGLTAYVGYFATVWARTAHELAGPTFGVSWSPRPVHQWLAHAVRHRPVQIAGL
jgi:hypothetical protein